MPQISVAENPDLAKQKLKQALEGQTSKKPIVDDLPEPMQPGREEHELCGVYYQTDGTPTKKFRVRELTGRDEEYFSKLSGPSQFITGLIARGLVSVGSDPADEDVVNGLRAGDWDTILLAIRRATFGDTYEHYMVCSSCKQEYTADIDLSLVPMEGSSSEMEFEVIGRHGTRYTVTPLFGGTQRKVFEGGSSITLAEINSLILSECITGINDMPVMAKSQILDLPLADRTKIIREISNRKVGPNLDVFTCTCPFCGKEDSAGVTLAGTFRP